MADAIASIFPAILSYLLKEILASLEREPLRSGRGACPQVTVTTHPETVFAFPPPPWQSS